MNNDRNSLPGHERAILEEKIIPTAQRWLRMYPALADHAVSTLAYWGEPLIDDHGKPYTGGRK